MLKAFKNLITPTSYVSHCSKWNVLRRCFWSCTL